MYYITQQNVSDVAEACMDRVGTVTTLLVKDVLRENGFTATQAEVSDLTEQWALSTQRVWNDAKVKLPDGTYTTCRIYRDADTPGQPPRSYHPQPPVPALASDAGDAGDAKRVITVGRASLVIRTGS